jgi:hypothetical protein
LSQGDEAGAQRALDASSLAQLSSDGRALAGAVASSLEIAPPEMPRADGSGLWRAEDIEAHVPLFKEYAAAANLFAKANPNIRARRPDLPIIRGPVHRRQRQGRIGEKVRQVKRGPPTRAGRRAVVRGHGELASRIRVGPRACVAGQLTGTVVERYESLVADARF